MFTLDFLNIKNMRFQQRYLAISADYRPTFKLALITLVLYMCCRGKKSSLLKLHLFSWALKSSTNMLKLNQILNPSGNTEFHLWTIEPALNRALKLGVSEGIFSKAIDRYTLTEKGQLFASYIFKDDEIFLEEKSFLRTIGYAVTEKKVNNIAKNWLS